MEKSEFIEFNTEIARLKDIQWRGYEKTLKEVGVSYLGNVAHSSKMMHSFLHEVSTYCVYLASADLSGFNVCPNSEMCKDNCLMGSGQNRVNRMGGLNKIDRARTIKTRLFFANKDVFMRLMMHEINLAMRKAKLIGHEFSVRINATSDINPTAFAFNGKNLLEIYPDVMFYDYTKVVNRFALLDKYANYDITWSIDGSAKNKEIGIDYLNRGGRVAVVFGTDVLPKTWCGYKVIDGDAYDFRYKDGNVVVGLKFKKTDKNYINGQFVMPRTEFIVTEDSEDCEW